jgi:hypothetical protein
LRLNDRPQPTRQAVAAPYVQQDRIQYSAKDIVLPLIKRAVADAHWSRTRVARQIITG